jgi:hypothetical protein
MEIKMNFKDLIAREAGRIKQKTQENMDYASKKASSAASLVRRVTQNPAAAATAVHNLSYGLTKHDASEFTKTLDGQADAYKHVLWAAETRRQVDALAQSKDANMLDQQVREALHANEDLGDIAGNSEASKKMDLYNNEKGIEIGKRAAEQGWSAEETAAAVEDYVRNSDGSGEDGGAFWQDKNDPARKPPELPDAEAQSSSKIEEEQPPQKSKPLTAGEELRRQYQAAMEQASRPDPNAPDPNEIDPRTGKKFGDMRAGEYFTALYHKRQREQANDNAVNDNRANNGSVSVRAHDREGGREHVTAYTRNPPRK